MSHRTTADSWQQGEREQDFPAGPLQTTPMSLVALPPAPPVALPGTTLLTHTAPHARCQCPRCRKRRARKNAARTRKQPPKVGTAFVVDGEVITVTPWVEGRPGGPGNWTAPAGDKTGARGTWPVGHPLPARGRRRFSYFQVVLAVASLLTLLWLSGQGLRMITYLFPAPTATVSILPASSRENSTVTLTAVTGHPDVTQVAARTLLGSSPLGTTEALASGSGQTPAMPAGGTLTFFNEGTSPSTIGAGTVLTGADGIKVVTNSTVTVPAGNPPAVGSARVGAHTLRAGSQTNIAAGDVNGLCCGPGLAVKNGTFSGGQDAQTYQVLLRHDIAAATSSVAQGLILQAQRQVLSRVSRSEQLVAAPQCHTSARSTSPAGSRVTRATISVSVNCTGEAFDRVGALRLAAFLFTQKVQHQLGLAYSRVSSTTRLTRASLADARRGTLTLLVRAQGIWRYQFGKAELEGIVGRIKGKSVQGALSILAEAPGVAHTSISLSGGLQTIPSAPSSISIVILPIPQTAHP